jgi:hypothetical protein
MPRENPPVDKSSDFSHGSAKDLQDQQEECPIYEDPSLIHNGIQCRKQGCNVCSPPSEVNAHEEIRKRWFEEQHKGRNAKARAKSIERIQDFFDPTCEYWDKEYGN